MLKQYGWSDALQQQFAAYAAEGLIPARVIVQQRGLYEVVSESGELSATLTGKLAHEADEGGYPVTGDWVAILARPPEGSATIHYVLPRSSAFIRRASVPVLAVSAVTGEGLHALRAYLKPGQTAVVLGSSGVGKSTLVNALAGQAIMATQGIREDDARGRHTTTHRELVLLPSGALLLDTPGMRELGLWDAGDGMSAAFADIESLATQCRFHDCAHDTEPGCAIIEALDTGVLDAARWTAYDKLQRELDFHSIKDDPKAQAESRKKRIRLNKGHRAEMKFRKQYE